MKRVIINTKQRGYYITQKIIGNVKYKNKNVIRLEDVNVDNLNGFMFDVDVLDVDVDIIDYIEVLNY